MLVQVDCICDFSATVGNPTGYDQGLRLTLTIMQSSLLPRATFTVILA